MTPRLQRLIAEVTDTDKKTVEQKVMKLFEEGGELSRAVLTHTNAHGSAYRDEVKREDLLEEIADCHIVLYSIAYKLGLADDEIVAWIERKVAKWQRVLIKVREDETVP